MVILNGTEQAVIRLQGKDRQIQTHKRKSIFTQDKQPDRISLIYYKK